jgi:hypothetical protein
MSFSVRFKMPEGQAVPGAIQLGPVETPEEE